MLINASAPPHRERRPSVAHQLGRSALPAHGIFQGAPNLTARN